MKLLILDKNQTVVRSKLGKPFIQNPTDQEPIEGVYRLLDGYQPDYNIVIVSNQWGLENGFKTLEDTIAEMQYAMKLFPQIQDCFFCPNSEGSLCYRVWGQGETEWTEYGDLTDNGYITEFGLGVLAVGKNNYRKPKPGMLSLAMLSYSAAPDDTLFIGDRDTDKEAAEAIGIRYRDINDWLKR
ncbi:MAG: HAD hydrolase-like protein [Desertifilum sp.]|nr:HAD hydrolase-like protein [Desertifilum sp.]